jgi:glycosyltransferase involved in cell wall biosynthesis
MTAFGFLSTHPPTQCGVATFNEALLRHLTTQGSGNRAGVVRIVDAVEAAFHPDVVAQLVTGSSGGPAVAAKALNRFDVALVQHEFGIYGGSDGEDVLHVLAGLTVPAIVVLHTVPADPSPHRRQVLRQIAGAASAIVVMSRTAARRLGETYLVDGRKVSVIPHGALGVRRLSPPASFDPFAAAPPVRPRPMILTWGLMGPGKGIEWAIEAFAALDGLDPFPRYVIAGRTHPKVLARDGEAYRDALRARAETLGVSADVVFDSSYRNTHMLADLVRQADVVLLPYDSTEQVTSGVLVEAVAARRPIIATGFPHAAELLADGAGLLVPHRDVAATTAALHAVLTRPQVAESMIAASGRIAPDLEWPAVARSYDELAGSLLGVPAAA